VLTCLEGRSDRTRGLAAEAGFEAVPSLEDLVREAQILLCILVPAEALSVARAVAEAIQREGSERGRDLLYADCNAIAPRTVRAIEETIHAAGARFADVGIVGGPPQQPHTTRFYASGTGAVEFAQVNDFGLAVRVLDGPAGQASGFKMCYGALTKGIQALGTELLIAAERLGFAEAFAAEQAESVPVLRTHLERSLPTMPPKAYRWVGEMEEIAACFADLGMTPNILLGAADIFRLVADSPLGKETPETRDRSRTADGVIKALASELDT
jgi:3-hydroxyisobutyrate dehydrogenase-like beta-hydroxyacid dehydrogenase